MEIRAITGDIAEVQTDAVVVGVFEGMAQLDGSASAVDRGLGGAIGGLLARGEFAGKVSEKVLLHTLGKLPAAKVCVAGLGKKEELTLERLRRAAAECCRFLRQAKAQRIATVLLGAGVNGIPHEAAAQALAEGAILGLYQFRKYFTKGDEDKAVAELQVVECEEIHVASVERGCRTGQIVSEATNLARDLVNEPANFMTPAEMANTAVSLSKKHGLECAVLEREQMVAMGMGALLGVAQGSDQPPKFIVLKYRGDPASAKTMGWVGKAITFDSGGLSLKSADGMGDMKGDMAGGAAVMAAMTAVAQLKRKVNVTGLVPATENLPSGRAMRPGDILRAMNGKTIEIISTDAEGRLILADGLSYAIKEGLSPLVDVATLTGACHIALGDVCTGAFANNQDWLNRVVRAGDQCGECIWPMPMHDDYRELNKSSIADIKNTGGRWAGAITGALFLAEFAGKTPWVHLDIAGTSSLDKDRGYLVKGATGVPVRALVNLAVEGL